jgi:type I restriction enzyme M protein
LKEQISPLKVNRLKHNATIHRLKFEEITAGDGDTDAARTTREKAEAELAELQGRITPLEREINQLGRQFWVTKEQVRVKNYDLSASRYRQVEHEAIFYEKTAVTLDRLSILETHLKQHLEDIKILIKPI